MLHCSDCRHARQNEFDVGLSSEFRLNIPEPTMISLPNKYKLKDEPGQEDSDDGVDEESSGIVAPTELYRYQPHT